MKTENQLSLFETCSNADAGVVVEDIARAGVADPPAIDDPASPRKMYECFDLRTRRVYDWPPPREMNSAELAATREHYKYCYVDWRPVESRKYTIRR
jgi:hypothetical protein